MGSQLKIILNQINMLEERMDQRLWTSGGPYEILPLASGALQGRQMPTPGRLSTLTASDIKGPVFVLGGVS